MAILDYSNEDYNHAGFSVKLDLSATAGNAQGVVGPDWANQAIIRLFSDDPTPGTAAPTSTTGWLLAGTDQDGSNIGKDAVAVGTGGWILDKSDHVGSMRFCVAADANSAFCRIQFLKALS